jgi:ParB family transcriptional regulator, chromosome partitioning protein
MAPPKRPTRPRRPAAGGPAGLPSSQESDIAPIVTATIVNTQSSGSNGDAPPSAVPTTVRRSLLAHDPRNKRESYSGPDIAETAETIKSVGFLQPLMIVGVAVYLDKFPMYQEQLTTIDPETGTTPRWVVVDGNRRLAAGVLAGVDEYPVFVRDDLGALIDEARLIANVQREDFTPLAEALALQELMEVHGNQQDVAAAIGKSQGFVSQRLGLLKLEMPLQEALAAGALPIENARQLARLDPAAQQAGLAEIEKAREQKAQPKKPGEKRPKAAAPKKVTVVVGPVAEMASALRDHLSPDDRLQLAELLMAD